MGRAWQVRKKTACSEKTLPLFSRHEVSLSLGPPARAKTRISDRSLVNLPGKPARPATHDTG
eukprot:scaffold16412_cov59-Phaeocystis_antarctica.AAC.14